MFACTLKEWEAWRNRRRERSEECPQTLEQKRRWHVKKKMMKGLKKEHTHTHNLPRFLPLSWSVSLLLSASCLRSNNHISISEALLIPGTTKQKKKKSKCKCFTCSCTHTHTHALTSTHTQTDGLLLATAITVHKFLTHTGS